ncbi:MAG: alpha/beta hydrolase [Acidimicrobiia bacterium]|nr:alpha/beta hydrolase [Acidimicrobiia bacterium]MXY73416.1 alpha/beta hydrolase [Acidimicrobiia bacterium]MYG92883.1 alpha/beta hydrolase [Acidimicrobiia bacterium]
MRAAPLRALAGGALTARFFGDDPPRVMALHGWGRDSSDFSEVLDGIAAFAFDLPGFGSSPPPDGVWGADEYAQRIIPVLDEMASPMLVLGHSFGGRVAVCLAARRPDLVSGLILTGAPLVGGVRRSRPGRVYRLARWGNRRGLISDARMELLKRRHGSSDYRTARGVMRDVLVKVVNESYEEQLDALSVAVHLVWGAQDTEVPMERARQAYRRLRDGGCEVRLREVDGAGHDLPLSRPDILGEAILVMLEGTGP